MAFDILIRGGLVIDGSDAPGTIADVGIADGRIAALAPNLEAADARRVIDATGRVVAPGFIDIKTHSDFTLPLNPKAESKVRQGVTTEVIGHCGFSVAPALPGKVEALRRYLAPSAPWLEFRELSFPEYLDGFPATAVNPAMLVGHNTLRLMTMGMDDRAPDADELAAMIRLLEEALEAGALGLSSGLFTPPGSYSEGEEIVALGRVLARHGARYATHIRDESNGVFEAVDEAIAFAEATGVHVQIVHFKLSGTDNWGGAGRLLENIAAARQRGVAIDCDQYPYTAASNPLCNLLPRWLQEGGTEAMLERLTQRRVRDQLRTEIDAAGLNNFGRIPSWDAVRIAISPDQPQYSGRTLADIAAERDADEFDTVCDYLIEDRAQTRIVITSISEDDVREMIRTPWVSVGSDGNSVAPYGITGQGKPHPRFYGTFPRVLGHYARDEGLLKLHTAVHKMTGLSATSLGLRRRGFVREGYFADVTVFDPATVAERASYADPHQYAAGIETVIVNGDIVVDAGEHTGALPGTVLRRDAFLL